MQSVYSEAPTDWVKPDGKGTKQFRGKISEQKKDNKETKWLDNMKKDVQELEDSYVELDQDFLRATFKKVPNLLA